MLVHEHAEDNDDAGAPSAPRRVIDYMTHPPSTPSHPGPNQPEGSRKCCAAMCHCRILTPDSRQGTCPSCRQALLIVVEAPTRNTPGQTQSVDQRPSLGCRPVGWRWGPRSTGTASEHLQWVLATATIALPPVSPWPLKRKNTSPNTCHRRTMSIPGLLPLPCPC